MFEPVSIGSGVVALGYAALTAYARGGSAVSQEARAGERAANSLVVSAEKSLALFGAKAVALEKLRQIAEGCSEPNWDGYGADPVDPIAIFTALAVIRALPASLPVPDPAADPDGQVSLDWAATPGRVFSISVGRSSRLAYSWIDGADQGHAVARFDYRVVPARVLDGINSVVGDAAIGT